MTYSSILKPAVLSAALSALALIASPAAATTTIVNATSQSWCANAYFGCLYYTPSPHVLSPFTGQSSAVDFSSYFLFDIPVGTYATATISIYNDGRNSTEVPGNVFVLRASSVISFAGLTLGPLLGSANVGSIDNGVSHFETIALNGTAVSLFNGAAGGASFLIGGSQNGSSAYTNQLFGYQNGPAAYLTLTSAAGGVPEPSLWATMILGFGLVGSMLRRRGRALVRRPC
jgi:hypothetical protein